MTDRRQRIVRAIERRAGQAWRVTRPHLPARAASTIGRAGRRLRDATRAPEVTKDRPERSAAPNPGALSAAAVECPICETQVEKFLPAGPKHRVRQNATCPTCGSLERHRAIWLYFQQRTTLFTDPVRMLHLAPERCFSERLSGRDNIEYVTGDLNPAAGMLKLDVTDLLFRDGTFDVIYASHVLEHVPDDRTAMQELVRVLRPGGWAVLQVPIWGDTTLEDPSVTDPEERTRLFGQFDHVRMYGHDGIYEQRLRDAGFEVDVVSFARGLGSAAHERYRLGSAEDVYVCVKPVERASAVG